MAASADEDLDLAVALSLQAKYDEEERAQSVVPKALPDARRIVDEHWELTDPSPDIHQLFVEYDAMFFWRKLTANGVAVAWSNRMTLCAGVCSYEGRGGFCSIRLSQPLLSLRPRRDLVETLLHEMIHAFLFVTQNNKDHDGHGPQFLSHMHRINQATGANISIYHTFHREVKQYRQHWWKCNGPCRKRPPYYGMVMRAMNRAPSSRDPWWSEHQRTCGGTYIKIKEPDKQQKHSNKSPGSPGNGRKSPGNSRGKKGRPLGNSSKGGKDKPAKSGNKDIRDFLDTVSSSSASSRAGQVVKPFEGHGYCLGGESSERTTRSKILEAVEKRLVDSEQGTQDLRGKRAIMGSVTGPKKKRRRDDNGEQIVIPDTPPAGSEAAIRIRDSKKDPATIITISEDISAPGAPNTAAAADDGDVVLVEDERNSTATSSSSEDLVVKTHPDDWHLKDCKTCPVCGMGNIPSAIINAHVTLCLEAEELFQVVDNDDLL